MQLILFILITSQVPVNKKYLANLWWNCHETLSKCLAHMKGCWYPEFEPSIEEIVDDFCVWSIFRVFEHGEDKQPIFQKHQCRSRAYKPLCRYITTSSLTCYSWILIISICKRFFGIKSWFLQYGALGSLNPCLARWPFWQWR